MLLGLASGRACQRHMAVKRKREGCPAPRNGSSMSALACHRHLKALGCAGHYDRRRSIVPALHTAIHCVGSCLLDGEEPDDYAADHAHDCWQQLRIEVADRATFGDLVPNPEWQ